MSLVISTGSEQYVCLSSVGIPPMDGAAIGAPPWSIISWTGRAYSTTRHYSSYNPVASALNRSIPTVIVGGLLETIGFPTSRVSSTVTYRGERPFEEPYNSGRDAIFFGSTLGNFADLLFFKGKTRHAPGGENNVIHSQYQGSASLLPDCKVGIHYANRSYGTVLGYTDVPRCGERRVYRQHVNGDLTPGAHVSSPSSTDIIHPPLWEIADYFRSRIDDIIQVKVSNRWQQFILRSMEYAYDTTPEGAKYSALTWTYDYRGWNINEPLSSNKWISFKISCSLFSYLQLLPYYNSTVTAGTYDIKGPSLSGTFDYSEEFKEVGHPSLGNPGHATFSASFGNSNVRATMVTTARAQTNAVIPVSLDGYPVVSDNLSKPSSTDFRYKLFRETYNWIGTSFYSSADAVESYIEVLKTNHLETLAELDELAKLLPDLGLVLSLLKDIKAMRLLRSGKKIIDLWSDLQLKWSFGVKPSIDNVIEFSESYESLRHRLSGDGLYGPRTLYGKFIYELPESFLGRPTTLITRSKVRVNFEDTGLLSLFLRGSSLGLVPSLSSWHDLNPFSFAVDWFTNLGRRYKDIDTRVAMLMIPTLYCVHSYKFYGSFTAAELDYLSIVPDSPSPSTFPSLVYYERVTSQRFPPLRESEIDFRSAGGPPLATAGALLWSIIGD